MFLEKKHYLRHENKANTKQGIIILWDIYNYLCINRITSIPKSILHYIKLTNQLSFKTDFQNMDQLTGSKWFIHSTKHHEGNQLQGLTSLLNVLIENIYLT